MLKFKKLFAFPFLLILVLSVCSGCFVHTIDSNNFMGDSSIPGNGKMIDGSFAVTEQFDKIDISGLSATINISPHESGEVSYKIDDNLTEYLDIYISDGTLVITTNNDKSIGNGRKITFNIGLETLSELEIYGSIKLKSTGTLQADSLKINITGGCSAELDLDYKDIIIEETGGASLNLKGSCETLSIDTRGAGDIKLKELTANDVKVSFEGVCSVNVFAEKTLKIDGSGAGSITYWGNAQVTTDVSGFVTVSSGE